MATPNSLSVIYHPKLNNHGRPVPIHAPHTASGEDTWACPELIATFVPGGSVPAELNKVPFAPWRDPPGTAAEWNAYEGLQQDLAEQPMEVPSGKRASAGVVVVEADGRVWLVHPTNGFGGYSATWPKGRVEDGMSMQATAVREAFEESGLRVRVTGLLGDFDRTTTRTRYYLAQRTGGDPSACGWESQATSLAPLEELPKLLNGAADAPVISALMARLAYGEK